ncbi:MAG TPA: antibiotic biosynthesis monooxygenase [Flavobacteriales bacterium]|nr:antibiotic biosynthesis monooxygenase [Flavobacteriales bacterium]
MRNVLSMLATCCLLACGESVIAQAPTPVAVPVDYRALPGQGAALHAALQPLLAEVRKEPHYLGITVLRDAQGDPDRILLVERWADQAYYTGAHSSTPHLEAFKAVAMPLLAGPPMVTLWPGVEDVGKP